MAKRAKISEAETDTESAKKKSDVKKGYSSEKEIGHSNFDMYERDMDKPLLQFQV